MIEGESEDNRLEDATLDDATLDDATLDDATLDDATLLRAHVDGHPDAFAVLVARLQDRLWSIALRIMRNPANAADALQDAYPAAFGGPARIGARPRCRRGCTGW